MTLSISAYSGSGTISTTEISMTTGSSGPAVNTTAGIYQAYIDCNAMTAADEFQFAVYEKAVSGGTQRQVLNVHFRGVQATPIAVSPSLMLGIGWDMTLLKIAGTDRSLPYRIAQVV